MPRIAFRCDVGPTLGVGHVMRSLALAEELASRGNDIVFVCDAESVQWAHEQIQRRGFAVLPAVETPEEHVELFRAEGVARVVFDSYTLPTAVYRAVREASLPTLALVDNELRGAEADLLLDQNIGSEDDPVALPPGAERLAGLGYALLRDEVVRKRPASPRTSGSPSVPTVLAVFGGTDAYGAAPVVARALARTGLPFTATLVTRADLLDEVRATPLAPGQSLSPITPTDRLPELVVDADLVVSAAGSSTWELLALGAAAALVRVADNQTVSYHRLVSSGLAAGLGSLTELRGAGAADGEATLRDLLGDPGRRTALASAAWARVDGQGRARVADRFLALVPR